MNDHYEQDNEDTARYHDHEKGVGWGKWHHHHDDESHYHVYEEDIYHHHEHVGERP